MVVIDMSTFAKPAKDTPESYEARCIAHDASRASVMCESVEKACFWKKGTPQYELWVSVYYKGSRHVGH